MLGMNGRLASLVRNQLAPPTFAVASWIASGTLSPY
jgi:hypothetical protein